ncbi:MAG: RNA-binding domain-containing protein [Candidatus Thermoplasmatota archaeon]
MTRRLSSLHARTICHATEDCSRVEAALRTVVGEAPVARTMTEGHFGNAIEVLESSVEDEAAILDMLGRMSPGDLQEVASTLERRVDESCQLFLRFDKQRAFAGELVLGGGEDVVAVRIKVRAFPAKREAAIAILRAVIEDVASSRGARA